MTAAPSRARRTALLTAAALLASAPSAFAGGTVPSTTGTLTFTANAGESNSLLVSHSGTSLVITDNGGAVFGATDALPCARSNGNRTITCDTTLTTGVVLNLGDLDDTVSFGSVTGAPPFTVNGDAGQDLINGSSAADTLNGGADDDDLRGGAGNDVLAGGSGADILNGGADLDTVTYATSAVANTVTLDGVADDGAAGEGDNVGGTGNDVENVTGGSGADTITGNSAANVLNGGDGNDTIVGGTGDDTLTGGAGTGDTVSFADRTNPEDDVTVDLTTNAATGPAGEADTLATFENATGGAGDDTLTGSTEANTLDGGAGDDNLVVDAAEGTNNADVYIGGAGTADMLSYALRTGTTAANNHTITLDDVANDGVSGEGDNVRSSIEQVTGGSAADTITGSDGADILVGGPGADTLNGGAGVDELLGGTGNDTLNGGADADVIDGGDNTDTVTYAGRLTPVAVTLNTGTSDDGGTEDGPAGMRDDVIATENVTGGAAADTLTGDATTNVLNGGAGDDLLDGGLGADTVNGGADTDTVTYADRAVAVTVTIDGFTGDGQMAEGDNVATDVENVIGGSGDDMIVGSSAANLLSGGPGVDTLDGAQGADTLDGGAGNDVLEGSLGSDTVTYAGRTTPVVVTLGDGIANDGEVAAAETDTLTNIENATGGDAGDTLTGSAATNVLAGGPGADTLDGGTGVIADTLDGGTGTDTASYATRTEALSLTLDATANDGADTENDTLTAIESLTGGSGADTISGDEAVNVLTGGDGADTITSRDAVADTVDCGPGAPDTVTGDLNDMIDASCESVDRGPVPALSAQDISVAEGDSGTTDAVITVTASPTPTAAATVAYATSNGTATQPGDYTAASGTLTFAAGESTKTITVPIVGDTLDEADETVKVDFSAPTNATAPAQSATITITDDDAAPTVSINDVAVGEAGGPATFTVTASAVSAKPISVTATTADGTATAPADYTAKTAGVQIPAGQTAATFPVTIANDALDEADETFSVGLTAPTNATISDGSATGTITDDDAAPTLTIADGTVVEGNSGPATLKLTVTASAASGRAMSVKATTTDGTAVAPGDYTALAGTTIAFPAGTTTKDVEVPVVGDTAVEPDETLAVRLSDPTNATLGSDVEGLGTITNDDTATAPPAPPVTPSVSVAPVTVAEGDSGSAPATFTVRLSAATTNTVRVAYRTADNTATAGSDYRAANGTLTFAAGETSKTVPVGVIGDTAVEPDETFGFVLSSPENATLASPPIAVGTITNDDANASRKRPTVSLTVKPTRDRTRPYSFALSGRLTLPAGVTKKAGCTGKVVVTVKRLNKKTVKAYTATVRADCTYKVTAKLPSTVKPTALKASARYGGNAALLPARSATRNLRAG